jgi:anaerobic selenocysteine-containing dehydrogenase
MVATHYHSCTLCEATCGITVTTDGDRVVDVRGDEHDPISRGYICPKATALADLHHDPDRLKRPLVKRDGEFAEVSWREAFDLVGDRLRAIRAKYGKHALGVYYGNPAAHNLGLMLFGIPLFRSLGTRNVFAATSVDQLPQMLAGYLMLGHQGLLPVPDIDRTDLFVCIGANPLVSNGSLMTAPNMRRRLKTLRGRGGRVVVVDPRRSETAAVAEHVFIRPGTDAMMLLSLVNVLFEENLARPGRLGEHLAGTRALRAAAAGYPLERTAGVTGVAPETVRELARRACGHRTRRALRPHRCVHSRSSAGLPPGWCWGSTRSPGTWTSPVGACSPRRRSTLCRWPRRSARRAASPPTAAGCAGCPSSAASCPR